MTTASSSAVSTPSTTAAAPTPVTSVPLVVPIATLAPAAETKHLRSPTPPPPSESHVVDDEDDLSKDEEDERYIYIFLHCGSFFLRIHSSLFSQKKQHGIVWS
jgi:hypothetical protein